MRYVALFLFLSLFVTSVRSQSLFISSDGAIFMTPPAGWQVVELEAGIFQASTDEGKRLTFRYGDVLGFASDTVLLPSSSPSNLMEKTLILSREYGAPSNVQSDYVLSQEAYRFDSLDGTSAHFVTTSPSTGTLHVIVEGSTSPRLDFISLMYSFDSPADPEFYCNQIAIDANAAQPGAMMPITGIPIGLEAFEIWATDGFNEEIPVPVLVQPDQGFLVTPIHPSYELEGGEVTIEFRHQGTTCQEISFTVEAIPEAPGELQRLADAMQRDLDQALNFFGLQPSDIRGEIASEQLLPMAEIQSMIDDPDNPYSLLSLSQSLDAEALRLLEAFIAHDGYVELFEARENYIETQPGIVELLPKDETSSASMKSVAGRQPNFFDIVRRAPINNAQELSYYMRFQAAADGFSNATADTVNKVGLANSSLGMIANIAVKLAESRGASGIVRLGTKAGFIGAAFGLTTFGLSTALDFYKHMLPSRFVAMRYSLDTNLIENEDDETLYELAFVAVDVQSKRWDLTKTTLDGILGIFGYAGAAQGVDALTTVAATTKAGQAASNASAYSVGSGDAAGVVDLGSNVCGTFVSNCNSSLISVGPHTWTNINLQVKQNGGLFADFYVSVNSPAQAIDIVRLSDGYVYTAADNGVALVGVQARPEAFGGRTIIREQTIEVRRIEVEMSLTPNQATPGDMICADAVISNAMNPEIRWELKDRNDIVVIDPITTPDNLHRHCFIMPTPTDSQILTTTDMNNCQERTRADFTLYAISTTKAGARAFDGDEPREDVASIYVEFEEDICDGAWRTVAFDETYELCESANTIEGGGLLFVENAFDNVIASGTINQIIRIEQEDDSILVTDSDNQILTMRLIDESLDVNNRLRFIRLLNQQSEQLSDMGFQQHIDIPSASTAWLDQRYRVTYDAPSTPMIIPQSDIIVDIAFLSPNLFIGRVAWEVDLIIPNQATDTSVSCDVDVMYFGINLNPQ